MFRGRSCGGVLRLVLGSAILAAAIAPAAFAACAAPSHSGLVLCFPSAGSTLLYPATIEMAANSGAVPITHVSVYDGNVMMDSLDFLPGQLVDYGIKNGFHKITVNAWDANGKLYQARTSYTVTGFGVAFCAQTSETINLCWPSQGSYQPESSVPISTAFAKGVKSWSITLDGSPFINSSQTGQSASSPILISAAGAPGSHTLVVSAVDAKGAKSKVTRQFYTFYDLSCSPWSGVCTPGINMTEPAAMDISGTSFRVHAEVSGNTKPTTKMIVYVDGVKKEQSAGPGITANVTAAKGSHYIVILAWDTTGRMYETYGNVNLE
jgi:hypothetical protein